MNETYCYTMKHILPLAFGTLCVQISFSMTEMVSTELKGHSSPLTYATFDPTGKYAITADRDGITKVWKAQTGSCLQTYQNPSEVMKAGMSENTGVIFTILTDNSVHIWKHDTPQSECPHKIIQGHTRMVEDVSFSRDTRHILTSSCDKTAKMWDFESTKPLITLTGHSGTVKLAVFDRSSTLIATASHDNTIRIWETPGGTLITVIPLPDEISKLHFDKSATHLKATSKWGSLYVWDLRTSQLMATQSQIPADFRLFGYVCHSKSIRIHSNTASTRYCTDTGACKIWDMHTDSDIELPDSQVGPGNPFNKQGDQLIVIKKSEPSVARILTDPHARKNMLTIACALHERLGSASPASVLSQDIMSKIYGMVRANSFFY